MAETQHLGLEDIVWSDVYRRGIRPFLHALRSAYGSLREARMSLSQNSTYRAARVPSRQNAVLCQNRLFHPSLIPLVRLNYLESDVTFIRPKYRGKLTTRSPWHGKESDS